MKRKWIFTGISAILLLTLAAASLALANGSGPEFAWWVFSGGGSPSSAGTVSMNDTLGQPVTGASSSGNVTLESGYWAGLGYALLYLPLIRR